jgi:hypothetical protein
MSTLIDRLRLLWQTARRWLLSERTSLGERGRRDERHPAGSDSSGTRALKDADPRTEPPQTEDVETVSTSQAVVPAEPPIDVEPPPPAPIEAPLPPAQTFEATPPPAAETTTGAPGGKAWPMHKPQQREKDIWFKEKRKRRPKTELLDGTSLTPKPPRKPKPQEFVEQHEWRPAKTDEDGLYLEWPIDPYNEDAGIFYFRGALLDRLDNYFRAIGRTRKAYWDAYQIYSRVGGVIVPSRALASEYRRDAFADEGLRPKRRLG